MPESYIIPKGEDVDFERLQKEAREKKDGSGATAMKLMERAELDSLVDHGIEYTITSSRRFLFWKRPQRRTFTIYEPTLAVLDEISREAIDMEIDDEAIGKGGTDTIRGSMKAVKDNATKMARIVAIATLGESAFTHTAGRARFDRHRVTQLATMVYHTTTPTQLMRLASAVLNACNLGSFLHATRLMSASRKTKRTELVE